MNAGTVVFFGTTDYACAVLNALLEDGYDVRAAVCQPDRPVGRKRVMHAPEVKKLAEEKGIRVLQPEKLSLNPEQILELNPDLIITCAYGQLIPVSILNAPKYGCFNIHPSALPKYRGGAPIQRAVMNGDRTTEVCLMAMAEKMDSGDVFARLPAEIGDDETASELFERLKEHAALLIHEYLPKVLDGSLKGEKQDESKVVIAPNIRREEERVSFRDEPIAELYNHLRGLIEEPMGYGVLEGKRIKFANVRMQSGMAKEAPGTIAGFADHAMKIAANGGYLLVYELQMEGKSRMSADAFGNGAGRQLTGKVFD
ncbi:MAG: methionyl-tRNA formyltransferase [Solobacterium sp.]|nr:methionyl-tRNA formyltransferase [Solobacterium sp.]